MIELAQNQPKSTSFPKAKYTGERKFFFQLRLTKQERDRLYEKATAAGKTMTAYVMEKVYE